MRRLLIAVTAVITAFAIAGCAGDKKNGDGVASAGGKPTATASGKDSDTGDFGEQMQRFAQCMREHGIDMPDPEVDDQGRVKVRVGEEGGTPPDRAKMEAAQRECQQ